MKTTIPEPLVAGAVVAISYMILMPHPPYAIGTISDDGVYVVLARALAGGDGYRNMHLVGQPVHTAYPPGVPLIFALLWKIGGTLATVHTLITFLNIATAATAAGLLWWLARARLRLSILTTLVFVISPFFLDMTVQYFGLALSEPYFILGWATTLVLYYTTTSPARVAASTASTAATLAETTIADTSTTGRQLAAAVALGLAVVATTAMRSQGIVLVPAVLLALLIDRRRREIVAAYALGIIAPLTIWVAWQGFGALGARLTAAPQLAWLPSGNVAQITELTALAALTNAMRYVFRVATEISPIREVGIALVIAWSVLVLAGTIQLMRRHPVVALSTLASIAVILVWPFHSLRFVLTVLPFAGLVVAPGIDLLLHETRSRRARIALRVALLLIATSILARQVQLRWTAADVLRTGARWATPGHIFPLLSRDLLRTAEWVAQNTAPEDRVVVSTTAGVHLLTGRTMIESNPPGSILPEFGPAPFAVPGRYLAQQIVHHDAAVVVLEAAGLPIARDIALIRELCPGVLERVSSTATGEARDDDESYPAYYRVHRDDTCVRPIADLIR